MEHPPVCVLCRTYPVDPHWRPFCSRQCQLADLGRWASEAYRVPGPSDPALAEPEGLDPDELDDA